MDISRLELFLRGELDVSTLGADKLDVSRTSSAVGHRYSDVYRLTARYDLDGTRTGCGMSDRRQSGEDEEGNGGVRANLDTLRVCTAKQLGALRKTTAETELIHAEYVQLTE